LDRLSFTIYFANLKRKRIDNKSNLIESPAGWDDIIPHRSNHVKTRYD